MNKVLLFVLLALASIADLIAESESHGIYINNGKIIIRSPHNYQTE